MAQGFHTSMYPASLWKSAAWMVCAAWAGPIGAVSSPPSLTAGTAAWVEIGNCVADEDKVAYRHGSSGALLDASDRARVMAAIFERYPMLRRDGLQPSAIAVWRRPGGNWLYATLIPQPDAPTRSCFSANVTAEGLAPTPSVLKKYFGAPEPM